MTDGDVAVVVRALDAEDAFSFRTVYAVEYFPLFSVEDGGAAVVCSNPYSALEVAAEGVNVFGIWKSWLKTYVFELPCTFGIFL